MITKSQIAGVTVLYNPDISVIKNIQCTANQVDRLYLIDNSEKTSQGLIDQCACLANIVYVSNKQNLGISKALNIGAQRATKEGYRFLLTMDQDSKPEATMVEALVDMVSSLNSTNLAIASPFHSIKIDPDPPENIKYEKVLTVWTSGSLLNLDIYNIVGPFNEDLFIDYVDHEFCLRLSSLGYEIYKVYNALLKHEIGCDIKKNRIFGLSLITSNHSALRKYYITRNRLYVLKLYRKKFPVFFLADIKRMIGDFIGILLYEEDKFNKFKMMIKGYLDYKRNKLGPYTKE